jgi:hypothetical protein
MPHCPAQPTVKQLPTRDTSNTIDIVAKRGDRQMRLTVDGDIDSSLVADFIAGAFADENRQP